MTSHDLKKARLSLPVQPLVTKSNQRLLTNQVPVKRGQVYLVPNEPFNFGLAKRNKIRIHFIASSLIHAQNYGGFPLHHAVPAV